MPNTLTGLNDTILSAAVLRGFKAEILSLMAFATSFSADAVKKGDKVKVPRVGSQAGALTKTRGQKYELQGTVADMIEVELNNHEYVTSTMDDMEVANSSVAALELAGEEKGFELARKVFTDIVGKITAANYGAPVFSGAAAGFDSDDVIDIRTACSKANMPRNGRALVLDADYVGSLLKDGAIKAANEFGSDQPIREGAIGRLSGFDVFESNLIPDNDEDLTGFAAHPSGLAIAMRYLQPQSGNTYSAAFPLTDEATGITIGVREGYDNLTGEKYRIWEAVYGYEAGNEDAIKRIVSTVEEEGDGDGDE
jgi:hypothetical protein